MTGNALGIFAKEPLPGRVKTRLCPPLTYDQAALLYRTALEETVAAMAAAPAELVLFFDGDPAFFQENFPHLKLVPQGPGDLGARLDTAFRHLFAGGCRSAAMVGSDSPDLPLPLVAEAFSALRRDDLAVIPARDGGYVFIGERTHQPELFRDIPWSTCEVWPATRRKATRLGLQCRILDTWDDLDDQAGLTQLIRRSPASPTARLASRLLSHHRVPVISPGIGC
jgi:hypothetical protein